MSCKKGSQGVPEPLRSAIGAGRAAFPLLLVVIVTSLCGCMAVSTAVSGIGARAIYGETGYNPSEVTAEVELRDTALIMDMNTKLPLLPYRSLVYDGKGKIVNQIRLNYSAIDWTDYKDGMQVGKINVNVETVEKKFDARLKQHNTKLVLEHRYRRWYGYPAQVLLVITIPIEAAFNMFMLGGSLLFAATGG